MRVVDLTGKKFGRLKVVERSGSDSCGQAMWCCKCECGNTTIVAGGHLRSGHTQSCGCLAAEVKAAVHTTHGKRNTRLYRIWANMKDRCLNANIKEYKWYGARGIKVCDEWLHDFKAFYDWAIANGYRDDLTIDRIDTNGHYCPQNCRWLSKTDQQSNKSSNRMLTYDGETHPVSEWAKRLGIEYFRFYHRLKKHNFDLGRLIECNELT